MSNKVWVPKYFLPDRPNRQIFLALIRWAEGTDKNLESKVAEGYNLLFSFKKFTDFSKHPRQKIKSGGITSSAAGAYQILDSSWDDINKSYKLPDFSPASQDQACLWLIHKKRGALGEVDSLDLVGFLKKCSKEWASLPFSPYGQPAKTLIQTQEAFKILKKVWL